MEFTTAAKKTEDSLKDKDQQTEQDKMVISDDAFAVCRYLEKMLNNMKR